MQPQTVHPTGIHSKASKLFGGSIVLGVLCIVLNIIGIVNYLMKSYFGHETFVYAYGIWGGAFVSILV